MSFDDQRSRVTRPCSLLEFRVLYFALGDFVHHPDKPDWGIGQVQSIVGMHVTVNFTHAGKQMINCEIIKLEKTVPEAAMPDSRSGKED